MTEHVSDNEVREEKKTRKKKTPSPKIKRHVKKATTQFLLSKPKKNKKEARDRWSTSSREAQEGDTLNDLSCLRYHTVKSIAHRKESEHVDRDGERLFREAGMAECEHHRKGQSPRWQIRGGAVGSSGNFSLLSWKLTFYRVSFRGSHGGHT